MIGKLAKFNNKIFDFDSDIGRIIAVSDDEVLVVNQQCIDEKDLLPPSPRFRWGAWIKIGRIEVQNEIPHRPPQSSAEV